jgi:hypothetical protein
MSRYCVYLTIYTGNKLPIFYIGSTSVKKFMNGYRGSVSSKEYGKIWKEEIKLNPHLFSSRLLSVHSSREEAFNSEEKLQRSLNVINNSLYVNKSFANAKFSLKQHSSWNRAKFKNRIPWNKGKRGVYSEEAKSKMGRPKGSPGRPHTEEVKKKLSGPNPKKALFGEKNGMYGKKHNTSVKSKLKENTSSRLKGKSYEELYGKEKADKLKKLRSENLKGKDNSFKKNPRFDNTEYQFFNLSTGEIIICTRWVMIRHYNINKTGVSDMINKGIVYRDWCILYH